MGLKINSHLQRTTVVAQPHATAIVPGFLLKETGLGWRRREGFTWQVVVPGLCRLRLPPPWGCHHLPGDITSLPPLLPHHVPWLRGPAGPAKTRQLPLSARSGRVLVWCPTSCPALAASGKAGFEIF